jgi:hypothetical protein
MAKQEKTLPARRQRADDESLLIRSAESLGRMIGTLQRQLDGATKVLSSGGSVSHVTTDGNDASTRQGMRKSTAARSTRAAGSTGKGSGPAGAKKVTATADRKSKRASKSAAAKKSGGRSRSAASRRSAKATRRT